MRAVIVEVETRKGAWCYETSTRFDSLRIRIESHFPIGGGRSLEMVHLDGPEAGEALEVIRKCASVDDMEVVEKGQRSARVKLTLRGCALPRAVADSGVLPTMPYELRCGAHRWLVLGQEERINDFISSFRDQGVEVRVLFAGDYKDGEGLTRRQREILERAVASGYYDYPRRTNLTELAEEMNISKATLCETLMAIESKVMAKARTEPAR